MSELFDRDVKTIGKHINAALKEELHGIPTVANFATVQQEGNRFVTRQIEYYNLDMIISIGYRVHSSRGVHFRRWANSVLKDYLLKGYAVNRQIAMVEDRLDRRLSEHERLLEEHSRKIDFFVKASLPPVEGVFFNGQIFDAFVFVSDLIQSARQRILLIDNYIDASVLAILAKRADGVSATIYTYNVNSQLSIDIKKHNEQYPPVDINVFKGSHDRFLIIDDIIYHIGASLKDLGKRWFAFSVLHFPVDDLMSRLR